MCRQPGVHFPCNFSENSWSSLGQILLQEITHNQNVWKAKTLAVFQYNWIFLWFYFITSVSFLAITIRCSDCFWTYSIHLLLIMGYAQVIFYHFIYSLRLTVVYYHFSPLDLCAIVTYFTSITIISPTLHCYYYFVFIKGGKALWFQVIILMWSTDRCYIDSQFYSPDLKVPQKHLRKHCMIHLYEVPGLVEFTETKSRIVVIRHWGKRRS